MIKVKDTKRLKAFGYEEVKDGYKKEHDNGHYKQRIIVSPEGYLNCMNVGYEITPNWKWIDPWFADELFDLQAAGLLERVNGDEQSN